jgi:pyridoxamine 5'-phosphate oxidase
MSEWRDRLRSLTVFPEALPIFDPDAAPPEPLALLGDWFDEAIAAGVSQPHTMSVATATVDGIPSARTLILKDVTPEGLWFASLGSSPKGSDLVRNPRAALLFYWREQGRQVRVTGRVGEGGRDLARADFLARHPDARAGAIVGNQSEPLASLDELEQRLERARELVATEPDTVPVEWTTYVVRPESVEFWQAVRQREQVRLQYTRAGDRWERSLLWP